MSTVMPFNIIDEGYVHADDPVEPLTVQIEAEPTGPLDPDRLHAATLAALQRHPLARARIEPWVDDETGYQWLIDTEPQVDPFRSVEAADADVDDVRAEFYSRPLSLYESPPLRVLHLRTEVRDLVMLTIHHAAADGIGALRLLRSIGLAYAGVEDPAPDLDPEAARRAAVPVSTPSLGDLVRSGQMELERFTKSGSLPARLAPDAAEPQPGYGFRTRALPMAPILASPRRAATGATVNDVLLTAVSIAAGDWNERHGAKTKRVAVQMPINARPPEWGREVVANLIAGDSVSTSAAERRDLTACLAAVARWTDAVKQRGPGPALAAMAAVPRSGTSVRKAAAGWVKQVGGSLAETLVLSNLGKIPDGELGIELNAVYFSPPAPMPFGLGVGAVTVGDRLQLTFRHRWALWSSDACDEFADLVVDLVVELVGALADAD